MPRYVFGSMAPATRDSRSAMRSLIDRFALPALFGVGVIAINGAYYRWPLLNGFIPPEQAFLYLNAVLGILGTQLNLSWNRPGVLASNPPPAK